MHPYQDPALGVEQRVQDLLARMTLREKVAQTDQYFSGDFTTQDENGRVTAVDMDRLAAIPDLTVLSPAEGAPHILSVSLVGWPSQNIVNDLGSQGICVSAGSACHRGRPSHVIGALKLPKKVSGGAIRLSFGPETTEADIDACADALLRHHDTRMPML